MRTLKRYSDPTLGFDRFSSIKYSPGGQIAGTRKSLQGYNTDGSEIWNGPTFDHVANLQLKNPSSSIGAFKAPTIAIPSTPSTPKLDRVGNAKDIVNDLMPYASNIINSFRKLPTPIASQLESPASFTPVSFDADRTNMTNQGTAFERETDYRVGNRTLAQGLKAKMKAGQMMAMNDLSQREGNMNAMMRSRYDELNQGVQARNIARLKQFNDEGISRTLKEQELDADNLANLSDKYQMQTRDKALQNQEGRKLLIQGLGIDRSMLGPDSQKALDDYTAEEMKRLGYKKKFGGRLKKLY